MKPNRILAVGTVVIAVGVWLPSSLDAGGQSWEELNARVETLYRQGQFAEATRVAEQALKAATRTFSAPHPTIVTALENLALLYEAQGRYIEAGVKYRQALEVTEEIREQFRRLEQELDKGRNDFRTIRKWKTLWRQFKRMPTDDDIRTRIKELAIFYETHDMDEEAAASYQRELEWAGKDSVDDYVDALTRFAQFYATHGQPARAESLYWQAVHALPLEDISQTAALSRLVAFYLSQQRYAEAEPLCRRALELRVVELGPNHVEVAESLSQLGVAWAALGRGDLAEAYHRQALSIVAQAPGTYLPIVSAVLTHGVTFYNAVGNNADVQQWQEREQQARAVMEALGSASTQVTIESRTYVLRVHLWRDFMPLQHVTGSDLMVSVSVGAKDQQALPASLDADRLWVMWDDMVWETEFSHEEPPSSPEVLEKIARDGPQWPTGIDVDVVVRLTGGDGRTYFLKAKRQTIRRTD